jgi:alpha-glucosidase
MADFGYDVADYTDVDPRFGTLDDAQALIDAAHDRGLRILLDYVVNHTSDEHPWFVASRSAKDNPKRDWYFWKDPAPDGGPPTNWVSRFGGTSAWAWDAATEQYYLHTYLPEQPDLNWGHPGVQEAMLDVLRFWMDRGVDGFRVDVAYRAKVAPQWRDNPPNRDWHVGMDPYKRLQETYIKNLPDAHVVGRMLRDVVDTYNDRVLIGEVTLPPERLVAFYGENGDEYHLPFNFNLIHSDWTAAAVRNHVERYEAALQEERLHADAWPNYVLGNHDVQRMATRLGPEQARVGQVLLLTLRGTPTLYYADELGMPSVEIPPEQVQDPWEKNAPGLGLGRDPARTPMRWSSAPNAGFCAAGAEPWLPVGPDEAPTVERQHGAEGSMLTLVRQLIALRRSSKALHGGTYRTMASPEGVLAYHRTGGGDRFVVLLNFTTHSQVCALPPQASAGSVAVSTHPGRTGASVRHAVSLRPNEGLVLDAGDANEPLQCRY